MTSRHDGGTTRRGPWPPSARWTALALVAAVTATAHGQAPREDLPVVMQAEARMLLTSADEPRYPFLAGAAGVRGPLLFEMEVSTEGRVVATRLLHGAPLLEQAAVEAVRSWRFSPLTRDGRPIDYRTSMVVTFDDPSIDAETRAGLSVLGDALMLCLEASRADESARAERRCHTAGNVADQFSRIDRLLPARARRLEAEALIELDRPTQALELLEPQEVRLRQQPFFSFDRSLGLIALARAYIRLDRADEAIRSYTQADRQLTEAWEGAARDSAFRTEVAGYLHAMMPDYVHLLEVLGRPADADDVRTRFAEVR